MSRTESLQELEKVLESFLDRAVKLKEDRLSVLGGINRLDDIAREIQTGDNVTEEIGNWFAEHNNWLNGSVLRTGDQNRIGEILIDIRRELGQSDDITPALEKINSEIDRWSGVIGSPTPRITLRRPPEQAESVTSTPGTVEQFGMVFDRIHDLFAELRGTKPHLLTVLDEALKKAELQNDKEALILSGLIIYYLKQNAYKVEPYVRRLKEAERSQKQRSQ